MVCSPTFNAVSAELPFVPIALKAEPCYTLSAPTALHIAVKIIRQRINPVYVCSGLLLLRVAKKGQGGVRLPAPRAKGEKSTPSLSLVGLLLYQLLLKPFIFHFNRSNLLVYRYF